MLTIKLSRKGKKNQPFFRVILLENHKDPWGNFLEDLGFFNPLTKKISLKAERIKYWISQGAQPSGTVHNLLVNQRIIKGKKVKVTSLSNKRKQTAKKVVPPRPSDGQAVTLNEGGEKQKKENLVVTEKQETPAGPEQTAPEVPTEK
jgi:small subunit ribosomal protein S16